MTTRQQALDALDEILDAMTTVVATTGGIPSGELYAVMMDKVDLNTYQKLVDMLVRANRVKVSNHYITAVMH
jgi:hypothetical protein